MNRRLEFTAHQAFLLRRLLYDKGFRPGTHEHIAKWLCAKARADNSTRAFVSRLIDLSCLVPAGTRETKVGMRFIERPVYDRDTSQIKEIWKQTSYYTLSFEMVEEESVVIS